MIFEVVILKFYKKHVFENTNKTLMLQDYG